MDSQNNQGHIVINGDVTLDDSQKLKDLLSQAINKANIIIIDIKNASFLDLSCLQLLYAAQQKCKALNKEVYYKEASLAFIKLSVDEAGFSHAIMVNGI